MKTAEDLIESFVHALRTERPVDSANGTVGLPANSGGHKGIDGTERWSEIVERGKHELQRDFGSVTLRIIRTGVPDAWTCVLPDGRRVVGELRNVRDLVESIMCSRP